MKNNYNKILLLKNLLKSLFKTLFFYYITIIFIVIKILK